MTKGRRLDREALESAILGGMILGGGGGGNPAMGRRFAEIAVNYRDLHLTDLDDIHPDHTVLTVSNVGSPASANRYLTPAQIVRPLQMLRQTAGVTIGGIITNENGGNATVNGWLQAAVLGIPLLDAPCNGRAHPTGVMGGMNLHRDPAYRTVQAAAGGNPDTGDYVECLVTGSIDHTSRLVRQASVAAGGVVNVARNPVAASYVRGNGAVGGVSHAIQTGDILRAGLARSVDYALDSVMDFLGGRVVARGTVGGFRLKTEGGFDVGSCLVGDTELTFWNEYMTLDKAGGRIGTFPDLIMTLDARSGEPLTTAMLREGMEVCVVHTRWDNLRLSATMRDTELLRQVEDVIGRPMLEHLSF